MPLLLEYLEGSLGVRKLGGLVEDDLLALLSLGLDTDHVAYRVVLSLVKSTGLRSLHRL